MYAEFSNKAELTDDATLKAVVNAVQALDGTDVTIDVTFPGDARWDGRSSMPPACSSGQDFPAGKDPDTDKTALEAQHCDPRLREPFIAALTAATAPRCA